jgi:hypothetical protein
MQSKSRFVSISRSLLSLLILLSGLALLSGCADSKSVRFKLNSVPKGAHVLYQVEGGDIPCQGKWIYLGNTPLQAVQQFDEDQLEGADKITLRVMHNGYHEQTREWDGESFWQEIEEKDVIFWTPELIQNRE